MGGYHSQRHRLSDENFSTMLEMSPYIYFSGRLQRFLKQNRLLLFQQPKIRSPIISSTHSTGTVGVLTAQLSHHYACSLWSIARVNSFFHYVTWFIMFYYSTRKVTNKYNIHRYMVGSYFSRNHRFELQYIGKINQNLLKKLPSWWFPESDVQASSRREKTSVVLVRLNPANCNNKLPGKICLLAQWLHNCVWMRSAWRPAVQKTSSWLEL